MPASRRLASLAEHVGGASGRSNSNSSNSNSSFTSPPNSSTKLENSFTGVAPGQQQPPPMGTVHTKDADGNWMANGSGPNVAEGDAWTEKPGPTFEELQGLLRPHPAGTAWAAVEVDASDIASLFTVCPDPLRAVADGTVPAVVIRGALTPEHCASVVKMFIAKGLMRDPVLSAEEAAAEAFDVTAVKPAGYGNGTDTRIDIGSSLVNHTRGALALHTPSTRGGTAEDDTANAEAFMEHSSATLDLFADIFPAGAISICFPLVFDSFSTDLGLCLGLRRPAAPRPRCEILRMYERSRQPRGPDRKDRQRAGRATVRSVHLPRTL